MWTAVHLRGPQTIEQALLPGMRVSPLLGRRCREDDMGQLSSAGSSRSEAIRGGPPVAWSSRSWGVP